MGRVVIKTVDGNRYELDGMSEIVMSEIVKTTIWGITALSFPIDNGMKYINVANIVSITISEE